MPEAFSPAPEQHGGPWLADHFTPLFEDVLQTSGSRFVSHQRHSIGEQ